ncbi:acyl-CoA dehydrogenase [Croceicoccus estronivorus]|uniref:acyl-CoA dehydrogenase family protein n=1 Tax=Croceicoccus estronivorus TaxID=1172626 RepID=UPI00082BAFF5|nr:acyl-CoA dehydrogenase family protein [Croceicoccus estronivorus]OCC25612.1 acyl-CoA dehydrogenase [Croceicoccus estronivorus]
MGAAQFLPIERTIFSEEHEIFRASVRRFMRDAVIPNLDKWNKQCHPDREVWLEAGKQGLLCVTTPTEYGGAGADRKYSAVLIEEQQRANAAGPGFVMHSEIVAGYIERFGTEEQKQAWLPKMARGEVIGSLAMTEPRGGSDLRAISTRANPVGDEYVINGAKTFITNGYVTDLIVLAAKTEMGDGSSALSLFLVEADREGVSKSAPLDKVGQKAQDAAELFFDDVRIPKTSLLGKEGEGLRYLMQELAWERLMIAIRAVAGCEIALENTVDYTKSRNAFGQSLMDFQNTKFKLAECKTKTQIARVYIDQCIELAAEGKLNAEASAMAKWWCTELQNRVLDECVQLHGGYGYMLEYPVARAWTDARAQMIYGGTNEIMKEIISRSF